VLSGTHRKFIQLIRNKLGEINDPQEQGVAEGEEDINHLQKELWDLHKEVTGYRPRPGVVDWTQEQWNNTEFLKHMITKLTQQLFPQGDSMAEGSDGTKNKWYGAGKKDAAQGKTANAQRHNSKHPEETLEYMRGYKRLAAAIQRTQGRTAAAQKNSLIPSSIPKKDEPKKDEKVAEENPNQQMALYNPNGSTYRQGKMPTLTPDPVDNADRWGDDDTDSYEQDFSKEELKRIIAQHLDALTNTQKKVLKLRFWDEMTLDEVAEEFSVSRERVRQIEAKALRKLKFSLPNANITPDTVDVAEKMLPKSAFAGSSKNKLGSAGQWKNTGPSKNRAARAGDLVGGDAQESINKTVQWKSLGEEFSVKDRMDIFEKFHAEGQLLESDEHYIKYFNNLNHYLINPTIGENYLVVPLVLIQNKLRLLDTDLSMLEFVDKQGDSVIFKTAKGQIIKYPSDQQSEVGIYKTFMFNNISTYNKFRSEVILKFNKPLPAVNIKDDKDKQVPISEDCENIMDVLINKIIVNEAIQNNRR
jgi:RNA polymerase sigma factor (sigma-70 family)